MTIKEKILYAMNRLPDSVTFADAIYRLELLQSVEEGLRDVSEGRVVDHEELFARLLSDHEKGQAPLVGKGGKASGGDKKPHRSGRAKNSDKLHKTA